MQRKRGTILLSDFGEIKEDEYVKDGLIYCKKCNTSRVYIGEYFKTRCLCKCQSEEYEAEKKIRREKERQEYINNLKSASLIGERYKNVTFSNTKTGENKSFDIAYNRCLKYCEAVSEVLKGGLGIYLYGDKGVGKTHLTACMANELMDKRKQVLFTSFAEISKKIRSTFGNNNESENMYVDKFANLDFLFIDDLGTERMQTQNGDTWLQEKVFDIINKRYNNSMPTIFTSNYSLPELIQDRGFMDKTVDRIAEMSSAVMKIEGTSYRMKKRASIELPF